jgi:hypothetical protein
LDIAEAFAFLSSRVRDYVNLPSRQQLYER